MTNAAFPRPARSHPSQPPAGRRPSARPAPTRRRLLLGTVAGVAGLAAAHAAPVGVAATGDEPDQQVTLVVYDSFPSSGSGINEALAEFTADTGITVELLVAGDAGLMATKALLTAGNPEGDVMFGIDNTLLSRVVDGDVFEPYVSPALATIDPALTALVPAGEATPVTFGDVCINYDVAWFDEAGIAPPTDLASLTDESLRGLLVVQDAAGSSPGLAFLMASIAEFGEPAAADEPGASGADADDGIGDWVDYWQRLRANDVLVVDGWTEAYYEAFTAFSSGGDRPIVVSYGSSPPYEVSFDPTMEEPTTAAVAATCFRQVEFAGVLAGTDAPEAARQLVDFLVSERFQSEIAFGLYVFPVNQDVELPAEFVEFATIPSDPLTLEPAEIAANREAWIDTWTDIVLR